jgi:four helix bundle protein
MSKVNNYRDLRVWQMGMTMVTEIYKVSQAFPREELYGLTSQLRRAGVSVPANIAEGFGRQTTRDYLNFLTIARGSLMEVETLLQICRNLNYVDQPQLDNLLEHADHLSRSLNALITSLRRRI